MQALSSAVTDFFREKKSLTVALDQVPAICPSQALNIIFKHVSLKKVFDLVNHHISLSQLWFPWELAMFIQFHMFCCAILHCWEADALEMQFWKGIMWPWRTKLQFISTHSFSSLYLPVSFSRSYLPAFSPVYISQFFSQFIFTCFFPQFIFTSSSSSLYLSAFPPV